MAPQRGISEIVKEKPLIGGVALPPIYTLALCGCVGVLVGGGGRRNGCMCGTTEDAQYIVIEYYIEFNYLSTESPMGNLH